MSILSEISQLMKARLTAMVVLTSVFSFLFISGFQVGLISVVCLAVGGFLVAGASNALNQVLEKDYDAQMERTKNRPVAAGRMSVSTAVMIAGFSALMGLTILGMFNPLTAFFGTLSFVSYAFIYTPLKRQTPIAVAIGAIPGAMPMLIGCVAYEGHVSMIALVLFAVQFLWQFTHFWAIAQMSYKDYQTAGYKFIPMKGNEPAPRIKLQAFLSALLLVPASIVLAQLCDLHMIVMLLCVLAALIFAYFAFQFIRARKENSAIRLMFASLLYLPFIMGVLLLNHWI